ncbi:MAG TPA: hypothetical protein P5572_06540 [Phycisphaerae bacterium]|nr:hypothetical protein [Phycisphaerae bacterium]
MMLQTNGTKEATARQLADAHLRVDGGLLRVIRLRAPDEQEARLEEPVKLLEINADTPLNGIVPVYFGADPSHGIAHASVVVEIAPEEFVELEAGRLKLPDGWVIAEEVRRASAAKG